MKLRTLLFISFAALIYITLSSTASGPAQWDGDRTGRMTQTCAATGCHTASGGSTTCNIEIRKKSSGPGGAIVTKYIKDTVYTVTIKGTNTTKPKFGFQLTAVSGSNATGTFSNLPVNTHSFTVSGVPIIEHTAALAKAATGNDSVSIDWKASDDTAASFYGIINAVDGNAASTNDAVSNPVNITLQKTTTVSNIKNETSMIAYPNPFSNTLMLTIKHAGNYSLSVFDLHGKKIAEQVTSGNFSFNTENWVTGYYLIQIEKDSERQLISVIKE